MSRPKKITDANREAIRADLQTMNRKQVCEKHGLDYQMISREFGKAWTRSGPKAVIEHNLTEQV